MKLRLRQIRFVSRDTYELRFEHAAGLEPDRVVTVRLNRTNDITAGPPEPDVFMTGEEEARLAIAAVLAFDRARASPP